MEFQLLSSASLFVTLLFFSFTFNAARSEMVYDTDGEALFPGRKYYILPVIRGHGGGVTMMQHNDDLCPPYVGQRDSEVDKGQSVIFLPKNSKVGFVSLSTVVNIDFKAFTICVVSTAWQLGDAEGPDNKRYVIATGITGNPGNETVNNWFKIEKWGDSDYKLVACPSVCDTCQVECGDVGVFNENGKRFLGLNGSPFPVMFVKEDSDDQFQ